MVQNAAEFTSMKSLMSAPGARTWDTRRLIGFDRADHRLTGKVAVKKFELGARGALPRSCPPGIDVSR